MAWCFRLRFDLGSTTQLKSDDAQWVLKDDASVRVTLCPADGQATIAEARRLSVRGSGFATEPEAVTAGLQWRDRLTVAFASINIGADFGDRAPKGGFTSHALASASEAAGTPVLNDVHGLMTYECEPEPRFLRLGLGIGRAGSPHKQLVDAINRAQTSEAILTPRDRLAYDLYAASFSETNADARLLLLMMAVETLLDLRERSQEAQELVDALITKTRENGIEKSEAESIVGTLRWLRKESISQAGRRLASHLAGRTYQGEDPETFFRRCYDLRSRLVHGVHPRPTRTDIGLRATNLEHFVGHLIAGSVLDSP